MKRLLGAIGIPVSGSRFPGMRVGINLLYLIPGHVGGTETYAEGLLEGLARVSKDDEFIIFVNREAATWPLPDKPNFEKVVCPISARNRAFRYLFEQARLPKMAQRRGVDVLHSLGYVAPIVSRCASVVTVHDLNFRAFGSQMQIARKVALELFVRQSILRASRVIAVSEFVRQEILAVFHLESHRVSVTHEAVGSRYRSRIARERADAVLSQYGLVRPYIIAFSSQSPNKNIQGLMDAFSLVKNCHHLPHQLVLVGYPPRTVRVPPKLSAGSYLFTGYVADHVLKGLLQEAELLVFPSFYEGFGLPVLEAMAVGVPVVCSSKASLPEVAGEAAVFFDPWSVSDMAEKIRRVAMDAATRADLVEKGFRNLDRFSWERTAAETVDVYASVCKKTQHTTASSVAV